MSWFGTSEKRTKKLSWEPLVQAAQLDAALSVENEEPVLIFKHSTRCSISAMALSRFEHEWDQDQNCRLLFLDLLQFRNLSNEIAEKTGVNHESPQALLIFKGSVLYHASHNAIQAGRIMEILKELQQS